MALTRIQHQGTALTTSTGGATLVTGSSALATLGFIVRKLTINSLSTVQARADVHLVADSSSLVDANMIASVMLSAKPSMVILDGPWWGTSGATIRAFKSTDGGSVAVRVTAFEETTG